MRTPFVVALLLAAVAFAGSRFTETTGQLPKAATDGVSLIGVEACRASVRYIDGGTVAGGSIVPYYYDSAIGTWFQGADASKCTLDSTTQVDGGTRFAQICEWKVQAQFGRAAIVGSSLTPQAVAINRLECWGPNVPASDGGAK